MSDPGFVPGLIGVALSKAIEKLIEIANDAINARSRCQTLANTLENFLPRLRTIDEQLSSGKTKYEGPVRDWRTSLNAVVKEATIEVQKCTSKSWNVFQVSRISKKLKKLNDEVEKLVEKDFDFSLHRETHEMLSHIIADVSNPRRHSCPGTHSTSFNDYHTQAPTHVAPHHHLYSSVGSHSWSDTAQSHHNMHNSVDPHFLATAQACHRPPVQKIPSLEAIRQTRLQAMQREEMTRQRDKETRY